MKETENKFGVGLNGEHIILLFPKIRMTKEEALNLAAWLVALSSKDLDTEFIPLYQAVMRT